MSNKYKFIAAGVLTVFAAAVLLFVKPENKPQTFATTLSAPDKIYGAMSDDSSMATKLYTIQNLGLNATRETALTNTWKGKSARCEFWNKNGIKMFLNINSYPQEQGYELPKGAGLDSFVNTMAVIGKLYNPYYTFIENEEMNNSYHEGELLPDYIGQIKKSIEVGHANGLKISNGGITSKKLVPLTYRWLYLTDKNKADWFLKNCVPIDDTAWVSSISDFKKEAELRANESLLNWYSVSDIDAVNFHLYLPLRNRTKGTTAKGVGTEGLTEVIAYLKSMCPDKKLVSNEIGFVQNNTNLSSGTLRILDSAGIEVCFYGGNGSKRFTREGELTKLGEGIKNYKP